MPIRLRLRAVGLGLSGKSAILPPTLALRHCRHHLLLHGFRRGASFSRRIPLLLSPLARLLSVRWRLLASRLRLLCQVLASGCGLVRGLFSLRALTALSRLACAIFAPVRGSILSRLPRILWPTARSGFLRIRSVACCLPKIRHLTLL